MSKVVDERVVEMKFDNRDFEQNVSKTMSTLEKFKSKLNLSGAAKGLTEIGSHSNLVSKNMAVLGAGVQSVQSEFSSLSVIGATCLVNLTNAAIRTGKSIISTLTLDPVRTGFEEYETKINSIQTILANTSSKGEDIESVTRVIDELNTYADKTIYNFSEMTRNIGTFTAAGVGLQDSADAIQGIANLAAMSGSNSQQASTAMYQLSQALAAGTVKLQDWNSVVNAGMGGQKFQDALKQTAEEFGTDVDALIEKSGSFRESLQSGWITADVLNTTLKKFTVEGAKEYAKSMVESGKYTQEQADALMKEAQMAEDAATKVKTLTQLWDTLKETAQSGWGKTWELVFGNFEEAKEFFTSLSDKFSPMIDAMSDARNNLIEGAMSSKWDQFTKQVEDAGVSMETFQAKLKEVAAERGLNLDKLIENYGSLAEVIRRGRIPADAIIETLKRLAGISDKTSASTGDLTKKLEEFQNIVDKVWNGDFGNGAARVKALTDAGYEYEKIQSLVNKSVDGYRLKLEDLSDAQLEAIGYTGEEIKELRALAEQADKTGTPLNELINKLQKPSGRELFLDSVMNIINAVVKACSTLKQAYRDIFPPMTSDELYNIIEAFNDFTKKLIMSDETADKLRRTFRGVFALIDIISTVAGGGLRLALKALNVVLGMFNLDLLDVTGSLGDMIVEFRDWFKSVFDVSKIIDYIAPSIRKATQAFLDWINTLRKSDNIPRDILEGIKHGISTASEWIKSQLSELLNYISNKLKELGINFDTSIFGNLKELGSNIIQSMINGLSETYPKLVDFIKNIFGPIVEYITEQIQKIDLGSVLAGTLMGGVMYTVVQIANVFSSIDKGVEALENMANSIRSFFKALKASAYAKAALMVAIAIAVLAGSLFLLSKIPAEDLQRSVLALVEIAAALGVFTFVMSKVMSDGDGSMKMAASVAMIAGAILMIVVALKIVAGINADEMIVALNVLGAIVGLFGGILLAVAGLIKFTATIKNAHKTISSVGSMFLKMAAAMLIMVYVIKIASTIGKSEIKRAMRSLALVEGLFILMVAVSSVAGKYASQAGSMLLKMSIAFLIMLAVIKIASNLDPSEVDTAMDTLLKVEGLFILMVAVSHFAGEHATKAGSMMLQMSVAFIVMAYTIKVLGGISTADVDNAMYAIGRLSIMFIKMMLFSHVASSKVDKLGSFFLGISIAMLALAASMYIIAGLSPESIEKATDAITKLMGKLAVVMFASGLGKNSRNGMIAVAACVAILCASLIALTFLDQDKLIAATACLSGIMLSLAAVFYAAGKMGNLKIRQSLVIFGGIIAVMYAIAKVLMMMSESGIKNAIKNAFALSLLLLALAGALNIISKMDDMEWKDLGKAGAGLAGLLVVMVALVGILKLMQELKIDASLGNVAALCVMLIVLAGVYLAINKLSKATTMKDLGKVLFGLASLVVIMAALVGVLWLVQKLEIQANKDNVIALCGMLVVLAAVFIALNRFSGTTNLTRVNDIFEGMLGLAMILAALAGVLWLVQKLEIQANKDNVIALCGMLVVLAAVFIALNRFSGAVKITNIAPILVGMAGLAGVMYILALVLGKMSEMDVQNGITHAISLSILMGALAIAIIPMGLIGKLGPSILLGAVGMAALAGVMYILALVLGKMSEMNVQNGIEHAVALTILMGALAIAVIPMGLIGTLGPTIILGAVGMAALAGIMYILALVLGKMSEMDVQNGIENAKALSILILALSVAMVPLGLIGLLGPAALIGVGCLAALAVVLGAAIWAFGEFIAPGLPEMANNLAQFGENLKPFIEAVSKIDDSAVQGCENLAAMLSSLAGSSILNSFMSLFGGDNWVDSLREPLLAFGDMMVEFSNKLTSGNFNPDAVNAAANAGQMLTALQQSMPLSGGKIGDMITDLIGERDMAGFGDQLVSFGEAMCKFSNAVSGIDPTAVEAAANAGKMMTEMAKTIPNSGGVLADFLGDNRMDTFGTQLVSFGGALVRFSQKISGENAIDAEAIEAASKAGKALADMAAAIPNEGGWIAKIIGDNDMATFGEKLPDFGKALSKFGNEVKGIDPEAVTAAANAGKVLAEMADEIPNEGGWIAKIVGENDISDFGDKLGDLGAGMKKFSNSTAGLSLENITNAKTAMKDMQGTIDVMPPSGCMDGKMTASDVVKVNTVIPALAETLNKCGSALGSINTSGLTKSVNDLKSLMNVLKDMGNTNFGSTSGFTNALNTLGTASVDKFISAFKDGSSKASSAAEGMLKGMIEKMQSLSAYFGQVGKKTGEAFILGFSSAKSKGTAAAVSMISSIETTIRGKYSVMQSAGSYLMDGLANGISNAAYKAAEAAAAAMNSAITAAKEAAGINSPSKVFYEMGGFTVAGFVNALNDLGGKVYDSGYGMADNARQGFSSAISKITDAFDEDALQPTIRPVLDLSSVESGASSINGLFSGSQAIGLLSNTSSINSMMSNRQNGNNEVVSAIDKLRKELGNVGGNTTNYINGITYDDGSNVSSAIESIVRAARLERRR